MILHVFYAAYIWFINGLKLTSLPQEIFSFQIKLHAIDNVNINKDTMYA